MTISPNKNFRMEREIIQKANNKNKLVTFDNTVKALITLFTNLFKKHFIWMLDFCMNPPSPESQAVLVDLIQKSLIYMAVFADIQEDAIFRQAIGFWEYFSRIYEPRCRNKKKKVDMNQAGVQILNLNTEDPQHEMIKLFEMFFLDNTKQMIMNSILEKMPQPEEAVFSLDESGLPVTTKMNNTSHSDHYNKVKTTIRNIAKVDYRSFSLLISQKVDNVMCFEKYVLLSSVCWTIGTISGCSKSENEKSFLVSCLRTLLLMTDKAPNINSKSQIASLILYIVGAYPSFINKSVPFMMCVLHKVFEFMKNKYDGVREMAVNTFRVLCEKCHKKLIAVNNDLKLKETGNPGFKLEVWDFLTSSQKITEKLSLAHKIVFFEAIGHLVGNIKDDTILIHCINTTLSPLMEGWSQLIQEGGNNVQYLTNDDTCQNISYFLRVNERMSATVKRRFFSVFGKFSHFCHYCGHRR